MEPKSKKRRKRNYSSGSGTDEEDSFSLKLEEPQIDGSMDEEEESQVKFSESPEALEKEPVDVQQQNEAEPSVSYKVLGQDDFTDLKKIRVTSKWITAGATFPADLSSENLTKLKKLTGLHPSLMKSAKCNIKRWFPVQNAVLPSLLKDTNFPPFLPPRDVAISAPTGSGKTLCYILPIINSLSCWAPVHKLHALVIAPVQNLVVQIENEFKKFNSFNIPTALLSGSRDIALEKRQLEVALVAFATPGRLMEHLFDASTNLDVSNLRYLVIDEADRMHQNARLEWLDALESAARVRGNWNSAEDLYRGRHLQKILVSATLSHDVENLQVWRLRFPRLFRATATAVQEIKQETDKHQSEVIEASILPSSLTHEILICEAKMKPLGIYTAIEKHNSWNKILVFVNNKLASYRLTILLKALTEGLFGVEELSSNLFGRRRQKVLARFARGATRVLICSDMLSRGIDVQDVDAVFNYDMPQNERLFVHRVGRTARCGLSGTAVSVIASEEKARLDKILQPFGGLANLTTTTFDPEAEKSLEKYKKALELLKKSVEPKHTSNSRVVKSKSRNSKSKNSKPIKKPLRKGFKKKF